ncbi:uncharacterized protein [Nicotiana tomentosiformis]|uniref:uncharacterized protein n=1 Tax=Nicotiana tomentosiformis TaxID=4098 RepID=UPI00388C5562
MNIQGLVVIGDLDLLIHQVLREWATKNTMIFLYLHCVQDLIKRFSKIEFKHVPRIQNKFADVLANLPSMIQHLDKNFIDPILIEISKQQAYHALVEEEFDGNPWFPDIKEKTPDLGQIRFVDAKEASRLLEEIHVETCGPHMNMFVLAKKISKAGYFWMTMETNYIKYVQKCHQCQVYADMIRVPPSELNAMSSPWPFSTWGIDIIGPIELTPSNGYRFILVAIDYFTKWVEAASYKVVTKKVIANFVQDRFVY